MTYGPPPGQYGPQQPYGQQPPPYGQQPQQPQYGQPQFPPQPQYGQPVPQYQAPAGHPALPDYLRDGSGVANRPKSPNQRGSGDFIDFIYRGLARVVDAVVVGIPVGVLYVIAKPLMYIGLIASFAYYAWGNGRGQTLGKWLMGVKVIDAQTGAPIGFARGLTHEVMFAVSNVICLAGVWSPLMDKDGILQGWHNRAARDLVVPLRK